MFKRFSSLIKCKEDNDQNLTLNQAIDQLSSSNVESMQQFAKVLSAYSDSSKWIPIPMKNASTNELLMFEERGKLYVGIYTIPLLSVIQLWKPISTSYSMKFLLLKKLQVW